MADKKERFIKTYTQGGFLNNLLEVWVDRQTGVNYLYCATGQAAGFSVKLDQDGRPVVTPVPREYDE